ncbi:TRAP transporter small permease [Colwellia sp. E2M01]|uniref:TRAP transporter small permease n=1 Tax=Colwellia sp. E2M01 TaxID=2841561 RepID=UPI001C089AE2|nr:TRAP transporter small permease [Colwellia sp. E2M01]MBU2869723.1 TRAP transporter small permease [Colwellia sp. E2M01]
MTDYKTSNNEGTSEDDFNFEEDETFNYADYKIEDWLSFILFWLLALTVFSQFVSRYVFSAPLGWTEETARYQLVCLGFLGSCIGIRNNSHIFVSLFHRWLPEKISKIVFFLIAVFNVVFIASLAFFCYQIIPLLQIHKMASLPLSISVLYGIILGSLLIMLFRSCQYLVTHRQLLLTTPQRKA